MGEVTRISRPSGPEDPRKEKAIADAQKFKELMKAQKVGEIDEEQKKKRKRKDESEAEAKADTEESLTTQASAKPSAETPLKLQGPAKTAPTAPTPAAPPPQEPEPHYMEEEGFMSTLPSVDLTPQEKGEIQRTPETPKPEEKKTDRTRKEPSAHEKPKKKKIEEPSPEQAIAQAQPLAPLEGKKKEKEKKVEEVTGGVQVSGQPAPLTGTPSTPTAPAPYAQLHPMVFDLFERMVGVMTVMNASGITETTVTLSSPQYANSVFFGAQIIIKEYSTAPKAFNIQIVTNPQGASLVEANVEGLMTAFRTGNYNFRVNRLEAGLSTEKPLFRRRESVKREKDQQR